MSDIKMSKITYTLTMSGLSREEAREIAENGSTFMWALDGEDMVAYPCSDNHPAIISRNSTVTHATSNHDKLVRERDAYRSLCLEIISDMEMEPKEAYMLEFNKIEGEK